MLDANALILLLNLDERVLRRASQCFEDDLCLSAVAYAEVVRGSIIGKSSARDLLNQAVKAIPILPFDMAAANSYGQLPFRRHRFDQLIAAHALALDLTLVTANTTDFADLPGLRVEDWTQ